MGKTLRAREYARGAPHVRVHKRRMAWAAPTRRRRPAGSDTGVSAGLISMLRRPGRAAATIGAAI